MSLAQAASLSTASDASYYTAGSTSPVPRSAMLDAYAVEEPTSPVFRENVILPPSLMRSEASQVSDVRMKGTEPVWYEREKDRIVITDLDAAAEEAENEYMSKAEPHPDAAGHADSNEDYSISAVLFDHIKRQANFPYVPRTKEKEPGALVLFKPPPLEFFAPLGTEPQTKQEEKEKNETRKVRVEEIDLDIANIQQPPGGYEVGTVSMEQEDEDLGELMEMDMDVEL
ncbi:hypothetical protein EW145_g6652 [Phellinidium pouzarii]|uniref:Uncharacterized protein n=1 Tax=Phellinidium pouzarii TaxID=167371 RepID=A0A4V3XBR1_9AGAM|nr:hypothetical protein EW145_g6652 [Phellinidium pouzarii]